MEIFQETYEELLKRLETNREQLARVNEQLQELDRDDPNYEILAEVKDDLTEVVKLVEELVENADKAEVDSGDANIGRVVEVFHKGGKRFGRIASRDSSSASSTSASAYLVSVFGRHPETLSFPFRELRLQPQLKGLSIGEKVQVLYEEDGAWYDSVITSLTRDGYMIRYLDYGQEEEAASYDRVRMVSRSTGSSSKSAKADQLLDSASVITTPGGYRIPENLLIKSHDSEKTRLEKKKKVSVIKKQQKNEIIEAQAKQKQQSWKSHQSKFQKSSRMI